MHIPSTNTCRPPTSPCSRPRSSCELNLSPGVFVAPQVVADIDTDGDREFSTAEADAYVDEALAALSLTIDGTPVALTVEEIETPDYRTTRLGYGTFRINATAALADDAPGAHQLWFRNDFVTLKPSYQANAFVEDRDAVQLGKQLRDRRSAAARRHLHPVPVIHRGARRPRERPRR